MPVEYPVFLYTQCMCGFEIWVCNIRGRCLRAGMFKSRAATSMMSNVKFSSVQKFREVFVVLGSRV